MKKLALVFGLAFAFSQMVHAADIAFYIGQWNTDGWYGASQFDDVETIIAETGHLFNDVQQFRDHQFHEFGAWVDENTNDGEVDIIWLNGCMPSVLYPFPNLQPDGSRAEEWLDGGNMIINVGDWFGYVSFEGGFRRADNGAAGAENILDLPYWIIVFGDNTQMTVTPTGKEYLPSLNDPAKTNRPVVLTAVQAPWEVAAIFASPGGTDSAGIEAQADPVVIHNTETGAYVAFINQADGGPGGWIDDRGLTCAEFIGNWVSKELRWDKTIHVDDDAINDPGANNSLVSDPRENGSEDHPYDSIQEAIAIAQDFDVILVHEGTYHENLNLMGKRIEVSGFMPGAANITAFPVIDAQNRGPVVAFYQGEGPNCVLSGFVLTGGLNDKGSAITCIGGSPKIKNCLIVGNRSTHPAGATIYCKQSNSVFENCTIADNCVGENGAALYSANGNLTVANSILWGNLPGQVLVESGNDPIILYTDVQGTWPGVGNIDSDPLFLRPGYWASPSDPDLLPTDPTDPDAIWIDGDYRLMSEAGHWSLNNSVWIPDKLTSPCIDAGDPKSRWADESRPHGAQINMGAYGGTAQASLSLRVTPIVAQWTFDESSGNMAFDSVGNNHGTVYGAARTDGIQDGALQFDGVDDYVDCGNDPALALDLFTISMWVYPQASSGSRTILRKAGGDADKDYDFELFGARNPTFSFGDGSQSVVLYSSSKLPLDEWTHVTLTRDETEAAIYINGTQLMSKTYDFAPAATDHSLIIGGGSHQPYQGKIDDVHMYDSVLSGEEIESLTSEVE